MKVPHQVSLGEQSEIWELDPPKGLQVWVSDYYFMNLPLVSHVIWHIKKYMLEHLFDVSSCLCSHLNDNCSHVNSKAQPPHGLVVLILGKANKAYRMSELLLHQCCLQGVAASDGRGSAVKSTPKNKVFALWIIVLPCLFVCLFVPKLPQCFHH